MSVNENNQPPKSNKQIKHCFILGILHRSGTNFLYRLLREHPEIAGPGPIWEDFFLHHSNILQEYFSEVTTQWDIKWEIEKKIGEVEKLQKFLGNGIKQILDHQLSFFEERVNPKLVISKTPSVRNIENFYNYFPDDYLIVIVRDGRSLVESAVRSFGWSYERGMQKWASAARNILNIRDKIKNTDRRLLIVKYEDIYLDEKRELTRIFNFLNVEPEKFAFEETKHLGITGSSELKEKEGKLHWKVTRKDGSFNPLYRSNSWSERRHQRFNWIAGKEMRALGYETEDIVPSPLSHFTNKINDIAWYVAVKTLQSKYLKDLVKKYQKA